MAGAFVDQLLIVQLLSACLPGNVKIYVKEHPHQQYRNRSVDFYRDLLAVDRARLLPRHFGTFQLIKHAMAVATATGTVGFESLIRGKPVFLFGHRFYQYAPGVFPIHSTADCMKAVTEIFERGAKPDVRLTKLFIKAYDDMQVRGYLGRLLQEASNITVDENVENTGSFIQNRISALVR
jgi:capsule polysaccharide export protein KpsC/LpsZ